MKKLVAAFLLLAFPARADHMLAHWVQMAPGGTVEARVAMQGSACPTATVDRRALPMQVRAAPNDPFPVTVCSLVLPSAAKHATILGERLRLPKRAPRRILVLGDTGCRIKGNAIQDCSTRADGTIVPGAWGFPVVAAHAAKFKPDLIIHVGDYLYRERCPKENPQCTSGPLGDKWDTWSADFFAPGKPLLEAAPWVIVRGNHEECARAGAGFLRLLGPYAHDEAAQCATHIAPYAVPLGGVNLVIMDNATADDHATTDDLVKTYTEDFASLPKLAAGPTWLAMHHPIWAIAHVNDGVIEGPNATLMPAESAAPLPSNTALMLAGHIHTFEAINYVQKLPPQLIVGEGGDTLDDAPPSLDGLKVADDKQIKDGLSLPGYGFLLLTRTGAAWRIEVFDAASTLEKTCTFANGRVDCPRN